MITERVLRVVLGDWSHNGHHIVIEPLVRVIGEDVSDGALLASFQRAMQVTGIRPGSIGTVDSRDAQGRRYLFDRGDWAQIPCEVWEALEPLRAAAGLPDPASLTDPQHRIGKAPWASYPLPWAPRRRTLSSRDLGEIGALDLYMLFVGFGIPGFAWERVDPPSALMGGRDSICGDEAMSIGYQEAAW